MSDAAPAAAPQVTEYPGHWAAENPDRPAIVMAGSGETMTFA